MAGYEDIEGRFGGEPDGGVITGCAEDWTERPFGRIVLFANEGDPVVALPGKDDGLASVAGRGLGGLKASLELWLSAAVEINFLRATSPAFALSSTQYATFLALLSSLSVPTALVR